MSRAGSSEASTSSWRIVVDNDFDVQQHRGSTSVKGCTCSNVSANSLRPSKIGCFEADGFDSPRCGRRQLRPPQGCRTLSQSSIAAFNGSSDGYSDARHRVRFNHVDQCPLDCLTTRVAHLATLAKRLKHFYFAR
ncbi:hypothetical protein AWC23_25890 [Mycobacterium saskatchewanense]|uniref:Uncharacterized protein n=1 Tax=Mycobacterium saskatchewanense TaxID=220927 RepID=A0AAJ3NKF7_9MYCO|nr:hypothetical protein AWC23_25890 [Mycobacterium saskatchewanense]